MFILCWTKIHQIPPALKSIVWLIPSPQWICQWIFVKVSTSRVLKKNYRVRICLYDMHIPLPLQKWFHKWRWVKRGVPEFFDKECPKNNDWKIPHMSSTSEVAEMQILWSDSRLQNQNLHFKKIPRCFVCKLKIETYHSKVRASTLFLEWIS